MGANQNHGLAAKINGVVKISLNNEVSWIGRIIVIGEGVHPDTDNSGYWDLYAPIGSVAVAGGAARPVNPAANGNTGGVLLNQWETLWYRLPLEAGNSTVQANYLITSYSTVFDADEHWIPVIHREDDNSYRICDGSILSRGEQSGTKDVSILRQRDTALTQHFPGVQFATPAMGGSGVATDIGYGFDGHLRTIGVGASENWTSGYHDIQTPPVGTPIYDMNGAPLKTWRAPVAGDRMNQLSGILLRRWYTLLPGGATTIADIGPEQALYYNADGQNTSTGTWHLMPYSTNWSPGANWILVAYRQNLAPSLKVFGGHSIASGDFVTGDHSVTGTASRMRASTTPKVRGLAMAAWTPSPYFAGAGDNGILSASYGAFVKWTVPVVFAGISDGYSSIIGGGGQASGPEYVRLNMPAANTKIPVAGTVQTRIVDPVMGVPLQPHETLYYVPTNYAGGIESADNEWLVGNYAGVGSLPHNAIPVAHLLWERTTPGSSAVQSAPPFAGVNLGGADYRGAHIWFMGEYLACGIGPGPVGQLDTIGTTESFRAMLFGAAAGATGAGVGAVSYPGWPAGYRMVISGHVRVLQSVGLIQFPAAGTMAPGNIIAFLPGIYIDRNHLVPGMLSGGANSLYTLDVRLVNATVGGIRGAQIQVANVEGGARAYGAGSYMELRSLDQTTLD